MKKSNLLKKAVSVLLVASALAGCGSSASQTATTAAPAAAGTEQAKQLQKLPAQKAQQNLAPLPWQWFLHGTPLSHLIPQVLTQMQFWI